MKLEFFIAQTPTQKGNSKRILRGRGGVPFIASSSKHKKAEETLAARAYEHRPPAPLTGPVRLEVTFVMPIPSSLPKWARAAAVAGLIYPAKRPDRGNLLKLVEDALEGPFYGDDAQIVDGPVRKAYGETPGYRIVLEQIEEATKETCLAKALEARLQRTARELETECVGGCRRLVTADDVAHYGGRCDRCWRDYIAGVPG